MERVIDIQNMSFKTQVDVRNRILKTAEAKT